MGARPCVDRATDLRPIGAFGRAVARMRAPSKNVAHGAVASVSRNGERRNSAEKSFTSHRSATCDEITMRVARAHRVKRVPRQRSMPWRKNAEAQVIEEKARKH